jgi:hypothetical protein
VLLLTASSSNGHEPNGRAGGCVSRLQDTTNGDTTGLSQPRAVALHSVSLHHATETHQHVLLSAMIAGSNSSTAISVEFSPGKLASQPGNFHVTFCISTGLQACSSQNAHQASSCPVLKTKRPAKTRQLW